MSQRVNGTLYVDGDVFFGSTKRQAPATAFIQEAATRASNTVETDYTNMTGLAVPFTPDGVKQCRVNFTVNWSWGNATTNGFVRLYAGANGNKGDTLITTVEKIVWNGTPFDTTFTLASFVFTPTITQKKVGLSFQTTGATNASSCVAANRAWLELQEIR